MADPKFNYTFDSWPDECGGFDDAVYRLWDVIKGRVEMPFTDPEFERFRLGLGRHGITLREVERVPYHEPEAVS